MVYSFWGAGPKDWFLSHLTLGTSWNGSCDTRLGLLRTKASAYYITKETVISQTGKAIDYSLQSRSSHASNVEIIHTTPDKMSYLRCPQNL